MVVEWEAYTMGHPATMNTMQSLLRDPTAPTPRRVQAALGMRNFPTEEVDALLEELLEDHEPEVRAAAEEVLLGRFPTLHDAGGVNHREPLPGQKLWLLEEQLFGEEVDDAAAAAAELREIIHALREGETAESLRLYKPHDFIVAHLV